MMAEDEAPAGRRSSSLFSPAGEGTSVVTDPLSEMLCRAMLLHLTAQLLPSQQAQPNEFPLQHAPVKKSGNEPSTHWRPRHERVSLKSRKKGTCEDAMHALIRSFLD